MRYKLIILFCAISCSAICMAQKVAIKTNVLYDATTTMNLGAEFGLKPQWTLEISGNYNPWTLSDNKKRKIWYLQPELRYWLCEKFNGHFFGVHLHGGEYNVGGYNTSISFLGSDFSGLKDYRYEGWFVGAGISYGYSWMLGYHWNLEAEIGLGYAFTKYDKYQCPKCGGKIESDKDHHYVGPTKAALNIVYLF